VDLYLRFSFVRPRDGRTDIADQASQLLVANSLELFARTQHSESWWLLHVFTCWKSYMLAARQHFIPLSFIFPILFVS